MPAPDGVARLVAILLTLILAACAAPLRDEQAFVRMLVADVRGGAPVPLAAIAPPNAKEETDRAVAAIRASRGFSINLKDGPYGDNRGEACVNGWLETSDRTLQRLGIRITRDPLAVVQMTAGNRCVCRNRVRSRPRGCYLEAVT